MAWDEWEQIKAGVAERQSGGTQLNQLSAETGSSAGAGTGGLKSSKKAWLSAGEGVGSLRGPLGTALGKLADGQAGLGEGEGCLSAAAQKELYVSWKRYAEDVGKRCGSLQKIMEQVGHDQLRTDEAVKGEFDRVKSAYADTAAVGGGAPQGR
ncbi:hypothetical protein GCM10010232_40550 [Streptomyces amakusaensis]|uniref:Uncharacterized protein n=1 Tax=Streptomyces amakusaensis TaxID=67271 RepID=A0ABW0ALM4_9ACTN